MTRPHARIALAEAPALGEVRLIQLGDHTVGLYRIGGTYHAIADRCPHRGAPLCSAGRVVRGITLDHGHASRGDTPHLAALPVAQMGLRHHHRPMPGPTPPTRPALPRRP